jgi:NAD(P)-dependent dehydrogenase (short-subunit alcohol dehydrogenase family)
VNFLRGVSGKIGSKMAPGCMFPSPLVPAGSQLFSSFSVFSFFTMAMNVLGKTALITGAGSGINFCFAKLLLSKGCNVVIADLALRPEAQSLLLEYPLSSPLWAGPKAVFQETDVTDWKQLDRIFEVASENFGGADIVCPGAGVYEPVCSPLLHYPPNFQSAADDPPFFPALFKFLDPTRNRAFQRLGQ